MKRLLVKTLLFLALTFAVVLVANLRYVETNHWKKENNVWKFNFVPDDIQLANFGSSHGEVGFKYDGFPQYTTFNFGLGSQRYFWDYGILRQYADRFAPGAVVLLPVSYFGVTGRTNYDDLRPRYYRFLRREYFDRWETMEAVRYAQLPVLSAGANLLKCIKDVPPEHIDVFTTRTTHLEGEKLRKYCLNKHQQWTSPNSEGGEEGYLQNHAELCQLVAFCLERGLRPALITTPICTELNDIYAKDEGFFPTFHRFIADVQAQFPGLPYFDYSHDPEFSPKAELFADGDHLNAPGAELFTARVVADLRKAGLLE